MSSFKKFILGEKMPDKDDPKYKDRYEKEVNAGMKFAKAAKIDMIAISVQSFANAHRKLFLAIVFGVVLSCFALNLYRLARVYCSDQTPASATERQEEMMKKRHQRLDKAIKNAHCMPPVQNDNNNK